MAQSVDWREVYEAQMRVSAALMRRVDELEAAAKAVLDSYELSNKELLRAGMLPEGKQPKYIINLRKVLAGKKKAELTPIWKRDSQ